MASLHASTALVTVVLAVTVSATGVGRADAATRHGQPSPPAKGQAGNLSGLAQDAVVKVKGTTIPVPGSTPRGAPQGAAAHQRRAEPAYRVRYERPVCPAGAVNTTTLTSDCQAARNVCRAAGHPEGTAVWAWVGPTGQTATVPSSAMAAIGYRCRVPGEKQPGRPPVLTQRQLRELPIPAGHAHVQPSDRAVLINVPTNVYVDAPTATLFTTVLGRRVEVQATASSYVWDFGDGKTLATRDPGGAYPAMTTTHTYVRTGIRKITLTTVYTARFRFVGDTEWLPAEGTAEVRSAPVAIELIETRAVLVN